MSRVSASVCVLPKASFTIMAFVENKIAPDNVMRNPAIEIYVWQLHSFVKVKP